MTEANSFEELNQEISQALEASEEAGDQEAIQSLKDVISAKNLKLKEEDGKLRSVMTLGMKKKSEDDYHPTDAQLEKINQYTKKTLKKEDVYVFELQSADMQVDRGYEHFSSKAITRMAELSPNKPVLMDHDWAIGSTVGKIFDAKNQGGRLVQFAYFPANSPVVENIMNGLYDKLSVGFAIDPEDFTCDACSKSMFSTDCVHYPGEKTRSGVVTATIKNVIDYFEVSLVAVPMQQDAHIRQGKSLIEEETNLSTSEILAKAGVETREQKLKDLAEAIVNLEKLTTDGGKITLAFKESLEESFSVDKIDTGNNSDKELNLMSENLTNVEAQAPEAEVSTPEVVEAKAAEAETEEVKKVSLKDTVSQAVADTLTEKLQELFASPVEVKEVDLTPINEKIEKLEASLAELAASVKEANDKLEIIVSTPTNALSRVAEPSVEEKAKTELKQKYWVLDKFNIDLAGGQE